jgi:hypothetical protein
MEKGGGADVSGMMSGDESQQPIVGGIAAVFKMPISMRQQVDQLVSMEA